MMQVTEVTEVTEVKEVTEVTEVTSAAQASRYRLSHWLVMLLFLVYTLGSFGTYCARTLQGEVDNHILAGEMFGTPAALKERGVKPLYYGAGNTGWDGQFYYYMSNDILARKDTPAHIDAPAYRYQRVGMSLYAATAATLLGRDWVSPTFYLVSYFLLILAATWAGARLFARFGRNPAWILLWSFSIGTQITLFNALPDAAADAFLILALAALFSGRPLLSALPFAFSGLSREVYALFPALIVLAHWVGILLERGADRAPLHQRLLRWSSYYWLLLPVVVVVAWQVHVIRHFHMLPSSQAAGILGAPLASWWTYLMSGLRHQHLQVGVPDAYNEAASLLLFLLVLLCGAAMALRGLTSKTLHAAALPVRGLAAAMMLFCILYACFGPTVMMHYSGYFKALAVFFFLIPLMLALTPNGRAIRFVLLAVLTVALLQSSAYNMRVRILPYSSSNETYTNMSKVTRTQPIACLGAYQAAAKVNRIDINHGSWITRLFGRETIVLNVDLTNTGTLPFESSRAVGGVFMSYHWVNANGDVELDGDRTALPAPLLPGQTTTVDLYSAYPSKGGKVFLKLSPVQEGCAWFYLVNPTVSDGLDFSVTH